MLSGRQAATQQTPEQRKWVEQWTGGDPTQPLTERQKMVAGLLYNAMADVDLVEGRLRARRLAKAYNDHPWTESKSDVHEPGATSREGGGHGHHKPPDYYGPPSRREILRELFRLPKDSQGDKALRGIQIEPPLMVEYGDYIHFRGEFFANAGCKLLDASHITFGHRVLLGPGVTVCCPTHTVEVEPRRAGVELAFPITIGDDVWIGANVTIVGPVTIGDNVSVGAGAVVIRDVPPNCVVAGVPAKVIRKLSPPTTAPPEGSVYEIPS